MKDLWDRFVFWLSIRFGMTGRGLSIFFISLLVLMLGAVLLPGSCSATSIAMGPMIQKGFHGGARSVVRLPGNDGTVITRYLLGSWFSYRGDTFGIKPALNINFNQDWYDHVARDFELYTDIDAVRVEGDIEIYYFITENLTLGAHQYWPFDRHGKITDDDGSVVGDGWKLRSYEFEIFVDWQF